MFFGCVKKELNVDSLFGQLNVDLKFFRGELMVHSELESSLEK
jgi:hypothetical protein